MFSEKLPSASDAASNKSTTLLGLVVVETTLIKFMP